MFAWHEQTVRVAGAVAFSFRASTAQTRQNRTKTKEIPKKQKNRNNSLHIIWRMARVGVDILRHWADLPLLHLLCSLVVSKVLRCTVTV